MKWRKTGQTAAVAPGNLGGHTAAGMRGVRPMRVSGNAPAAGSRGQVRVIPCLQCGVMVSRLPSQIRGSVFCSRACMGLHQRVPVSGTCVVCGAPWHDDMTTGLHRDAQTCLRHRGIMQNTTHALATGRKPAASYAVSLTKLAYDIRRRSRTRPLDFDLTLFTDTGAK